MFGFKLALFLEELASVLLAYSLLRCAGELATIETVSEQSRRCGILCCGLCIQHASIANAPDALCLWCVGCAPLHANRPSGILPSAAACAILHYVADTTHSSILHAKILNLKLCMHPKPLAHRCLANLLLQAPYCTLLRTPPTTSSSTLHALTPYLNLCMHPESLPSCCLAKLLQAPSCSLLRTPPLEWRVWVTCAALLCLTSVATATASMAHQHTHQQRGCAASRCASMEQQIGPWVLLVCWWSNSCC